MTSRSGTLSAGQVAQVDQAERRHRLERAVARRVPPLPAPCVKRLVGELDLAGLGERLAGFDEQLDPQATHRRPRARAARRSRLAVAGMSPRANARRPAAARRSEARRAQLDAVVVERSELAEVAMGLLEVVAEDLLELERAVALRVAGVRPRDESLVERRPGALEEAVVASCRG